VETEAGNWKLPGSRAAVVKDYVVRKGIPDNRVYTEGKGSSQPITKPNQCTGSRSIEVIECLRPDRHVDIEAIGTKMDEKSAKVEPPSLRLISRCLQSWIWCRFAIYKRHCDFFISDVFLGSENLALLLFHRC
jgi:hypothetical protein